MSSIALAGAPCLTIDGLADVIFQTESKTWDFLRKGGHMRIYGTLDWPSVLFLSIYESNDQTDWKRPWSFILHRILVP